VIKHELPLFNHDDHRLLLFAADSHPQPGTAECLRRLAHRLGRVLQSTDKTKYTLTVRYLLEPDGSHQPEATIAPEGYVNCDVDLHYIEEDHDLTYQVAPLWEAAGIGFHNWSQGGGGDMFTIIDPNRAEEACEIAWQTQQKLEQWYRDNPETDEERAARVQHILQHDAEARAVVERLRQLEAEAVDKPASND
jgi:hypothetical protein